MNTDWVINVILLAMFFNSMVTTAVGALLAPQRSGLRPGLYGVTIGLAVAVAITAIALYNAN